MATRTHARQMVVELLYAFAMGNERIFDFADSLLSAKKIRNAQADFAKGLFGGVVAHLAQIDSIINANLKSWEISRLGVIDKCILRLGVYEILKGEIDAPVAINEAIEIAKILGSERTGGFVNGVLDAVRKGDFDLEKGVESVVDLSESSVDLDSANRTKSAESTPKNTDSVKKRDFVRQRKDSATRTSKKRNFTDSAKNADFRQKRKTDSTKKYKRDSAKKTNFTPKNQAKKSYAKKPPKSR
ncbi:transcription antitermination factor NusB [Helicobacter sp. 23-1044]